MHEVSYIVPPLYSGTAPLNVLAEMYPIGAPEQPDDMITLLLAMHEVPKGVPPR
jgi:hypothetical protein